MSIEQKIILERHHLKHLPNLSVNENIFDHGFAAFCSIAKCNAECCKGGVWVDINERERILAAADIIQRHMEPHQEKDSSQWFENNEIIDHDFPSGKAIGTQVRPHSCVFLKSDGRCVLQTAASAEGLGRFNLKPFFCIAFPITIDHGELQVDDPDYTDRQECCSAISPGERTVFEVCGEELEYVLGKAGVEELERLASSRQMQDKFPS